MRRNNKLAAGAILGTLLALIAFWFWGEDGQENEPMLKERSGSELNSGTASIKSESGETDVLSRRTQASVRPGQFLKGILNNKIVFYGRVVDSAEEPVEGAQVAYAQLDAKAFANAWEGGVDYEQTVSDSAGRFEIAGKGGSLSVYISRDDYYTIPGESKGSFSYGMPSGDVPSTDPKNPVTFRLRKKGETEPLYYFDRPRLSRNSWVMVPEGQTLYLDPRTGDVTETAIPNGISISQTNNRPPKKDRNWDPREYDWEMRLEIKGGGFIERQGRFDFLAPRSGYVEEVFIGKKRGDPDWKRFLVREFFVKYGNQTYGQFWIDASTDAFRYRSHWNPGGSRNLEYDPEKRINLEK